MKIPRRVQTASLFATALLLSGPTLLAVPSVTLSFYETGQATVELPTGLVFPIPSLLAPDPGPGGLSSALTFLPTPALAPFVVGDVILLDANGTISDVFRFNSGTTVTDQGFTSPIVFYSNDSGGLPADTGLPTAFYTNTVTIVESSSGPTIYTPIAGQPGFEAGFPLPVTYQIFSTPDASSTLPLLGMAVVGMALLRSKVLRLGEGFRQKPL